MDEARRKRDELLKKEEEAARARKPVDAAWATLALVLWMNAHVAVAATLVDCIVEAIAIVNSGQVRLLRGPLAVMVLAGMAWLHCVQPRDINNRESAAGFGCFFVVVCGVIGFLTVSSLNSFTGYDFFQVRWGAVYLGVSLILFSIWGYGRETPLEHAERMMANGRFGKATSIVERILESDPDNLPALKMQKELREMLKAV